MVRRIGISKLNYNDIKRRYKDDEGWISSKKFAPFPFELVNMKLDKTIKEINGWYTGTKWDGLRFKKGDKVTFWRRISEEDKLEND